MGRPSDRAPPAHSSAADMPRGPSHEGPAYDRGRYLRTGEVRKALGSTEVYVRRCVAAGKLPKPKRLGRNYLFPRAATELAIARLLRETGKRVMTAGEIDALAVKMLAEGESEGAIVMALAISVERLAKLRRSLRLPEENELAIEAPAAAPPPAADEGEWWENFRARAAQRRKDHLR